MSTHSGAAIGLRRDAAVVDADAAWRIAFAVAVAIGAHARLAGLGRDGLWHDEGWSLWFALHAGWPDLLRENHPPLYYLLLRAAAEVVGSDAALRATGTIASCASVALAYALARATAGTSRAGLAAASIVAVAGVDVFTARELRMYPWMTTAFGVALYCGHRVARGGGAGPLAGFGLASVALLYLHGIGGYFVAGALAYGLVAARDRGSRMRLAAVAVLAGLAFLPWFVASTLHRLDRMGGGLAWRAVPGPGELLHAAPRLLVGPTPPWADPLAPAGPCDLALAPSLCGAAGFTNALARGRWPAIVVIALVAAVIVAGWPRRGERASSWRESAALLAAIAVPYAMLAATALFAVPFWDVRYLSACVVPLAVLLAVRGTARGRVSGHGATLALMAATAIASLALPQQGPWEQWREAMRFLDAERRPGEAVVLNSLGQGTQLLFRRYAPDPDGVRDALVLREHVDDDYGPPRCPGPTRSCLDALALPADAASVAWMVRGARLDVPRHPFHAALSGWLEATFEVERTYRFQSVEVIRMRVRGR